MAEQENATPIEIVYVLNKDGSHLKPMFSFARARRKLKQKKAIIVYISERSGVWSEQGL